MEIWKFEKQLLLNVLQLYFPNAFV
jgi:hypothetical protein